MRNWIQIAIYIVIVVVVVVNLVVVINRDCATQEQVEQLEGKIDVIEGKIDDIEVKLDDFLPKIWDEVLRIEEKLDYIMPLIDEIWEEVHKPCCCAEEKQVKVKQIPIPWQFWRTINGGVKDVIQLSNTYCQPVLVYREWAVLPVAIPLDDLTWQETEAWVMEYGGMEVGWTGWDQEPVLMNPGDEITVDIMTESVAEDGPYDVLIPYEEVAAVVLRYWVAEARAPDDPVIYVVNEALLESASPQVIIGQLTNFEVHNNTCVEVDNFELELYGIQTSDILGWYWQGRPIVRDWRNRPWGPTLYGGWGTPPYITVLPDGAVEVKWKDPDYPIKSCQWVHFGLYIRPGVYPTGIQAFWTILVN